MTNVSALLAADPPSRALRWAEYHAGSQICGIRHLPGGTTAAVHALDFESGHRLVMKRFALQWFVDEEPERARHEAAALAILEGTDVPAPRVVAYDETGVEAGAPALLSTFVPGRPAINLDHQRLAEVAAAISKVSPLDLSWQYRPYFVAYPLFAPSWTQQHAAWATLIDAATTLEPVSTSFVHRDFHPGNVIARGGIVSGVVDWLSACVGPWEIDVAHCRLNLVLAGLVESADRYLRHYEAITGRSYDPAWDAMAAVDSLPFYAGRAAVRTWAGLSHAGKEGAVQRQRLDDFVADFSAGFA